MAKNKKLANNKKKKLIGIIIIILVGIGIVVTLLAVKQSTESRQHASSFQDINSSDQITQTNNPDGTMGVVDYTQNFSNTLPNEFLGSLNFQVTDPSQGARPTHTLPTQAQGNGGNGNDNGQDNSNRPSGTPGQGNNNQNNNGGGVQTVTSLTVTITKVEVHLAHVGIPGSRNENNGNSSPTSTHSSLSGTPPPSTNQDVDKWEVLKSNAPQTVDLVQLAKNNSLSSLGITKLANGRYTEIRLYVSTASAILQDGAKVTLTIPGSANIVRIVQPFVINSARTTTLTIDFDAQNSVIHAGNVYILKPVVVHLLENDEQ